MSGPLEPEAIRDTGFPFGTTTIKEIFRLCALHARSPMSEVFEFYTPEYAEQAINTILATAQAEARIETIAALNPYLNNKLDVEGQIKMTETLVALQKGNL